MAKFHNGLVAEVRQSQKDKQQQKRLHEKYNVSEEVTIVEKNHFIKFFINILLHALKITATITLCFLALTGLLSIIYPETRNILIDILYDSLQFILK